MIWIFNSDDDYFIGQFPVRNDFPKIQGPGLGPLILTPQAAVAGLGDELFLEPLGERQRGSFSRVSPVGLNG